MEYIELYNKYKYEFDEYYLDESKQMWNIFFEKYKEQKNIDDIARTYYMSESTIKRKILSVKKFFNDIDNVIIQQKIFRTDVITPIYKLLPLSFVATELLKYCIVHVEQIIIKYGMDFFKKIKDREFKVSREELIVITDLFKRKKYSNKKIDELLTSTIKGLNIFTSIRMYKGALYYVFCNEILTLISLFVNNYCESILDM